MAETKHTPGPWERHVTSNNSGLIRARADKSERPSGWKGVASVHGQDNDDEMEANADLICRAPDLLALASTLAAALRRIAHHACALKGIGGCKSLNPPSDVPCLSCIARAALRAAEEAGV